MAGTTGPHDVGGVDEDFGPIDIASGSKKYKLWETQTHCLLTLLSKKGLMSVDEVRLTPAARLKVLHRMKLHVQGFETCAESQRSGRLATRSHGGHELL